MKKLTMAIIGALITSFLLLILGIGFGVGLKKSSKVKENKITTSFINPVPTSLPELLSKNDIKLTSISDSSLSLTTTMKNNNIPTTSGPVIHIGSTISGNVVEKSKFVSTSSNLQSSLMPNADSYLDTDTTNQSHFSTNNPEINPFDFQSDTCFANITTLKQDYKENFKHFIDDAYNFGKKIFNENQFGYSSYLSKSNNTFVNNYLEFLLTPNPDYKATVIREFSESHHDFRDTVLTKYLWNIMNEISTDVLRLIRDREMSISGFYFEPLFYWTDNFKVIAKHLENWNEVEKFDDDLTGLHNKLTLIKSSLTNQPYHGSVYLPDFMPSRLTSDRPFYEIVSMLDEIIDENFDPGQSYQQISSITDFSKLNPVIYGYVVETVSGCRLKFIKETIECNYHETCRHKAFTRKNEIDDVAELFEFMVLWGVKENEVSTSAVPEIKQSVEPILD